MPHHPILVAGVDRQQVDPAGIDHRGPVRGRQAALGVARIRQQALDVVTDLDGREVVDRARPRVIGVHERQGDRKRIGRTGHAGFRYRAENRLVHQRLPHLGLPVPGARVVIDGQRVLEHRRQQRIAVRDGLEVAAVRRREIPLPPAALEPGAVVLGNPVVQYAAPRRRLMDVRPGLAKRPATAISASGHRLQLGEQVTEECPQPFPAFRPGRGERHPRIGLGLAAGGVRTRVGRVVWTHDPPVVVIAASRQIHDVITTGRSASIKASNEANNSSTFTMRPVRLRVTPIRV